MELIEKFKNKTFYFLLSAFYFLNAGIASAAILPACDAVGAGGLPKCNLCHVLELVKNLTNFALEIGVVLAGLFFTWGAFVIMTAGDSETKVEEGKKIITTVVTGLVIAFSAWLIVATLLQILTGSPSKLPWDKIQCTI